MTYKNLRGHLEARKKAAGVWLALLLTSTFLAFAPAAQAAPNWATGAELVTPRAGVTYVFYQSNTYQRLHCSGEIAQRNLDVRSITWADFEGRRALVGNKRPIQNCSDLDKLFPDEPPTRPVQPPPPVKPAPKPKPPKPVAPKPKPGAPAPRPVSSYSCAGKRATAVVENGVVRRAPNSSFTGSQVVVMVDTTKLNVVGGANQTADAKNVFTGYVADLSGDDPQRIYLCGTSADDSVTSDMKGLIFHAGDGDDTFVGSADQVFGGNGDDVIRGNNWAWVEGHHNQD